MAEYIKITYDDGEVWRAKYDKDNDRYCSEGVMYVSGSDSSKVELLPNEFLNASYEELLEFEELTVEEITKEEYDKQSKSFMVEYFDEEIEALENEIAELKKEREKYL